MKQEIEFDIEDQAYRFFDKCYPEVDNDNITDAGPAFAAIESFSDYVNKRVDNVLEVDVDMLNKYLKTHVPEDVLWYKEVGPILANLIIYWRSEYFKLKYPQNYKR